MTIKWLKTSEHLPDLDKPVLGWWSESCIQSVVLRAHLNRGNRWNKPGYWVNEEVTEPPYWAKLPQTPTL